MLLGELIIAGFLIWFAASRSPKPHPPTPSTPHPYDPSRGQIAGEIASWSNSPEITAEQRQLYLEVAYYVRTGTSPVSQSASAEPLYGPVVDVALQQPPKPPLTLADAFKSLDNINILLYLGAFLIVVSAGIFIGYNFGVLSGLTKVLIIAAFAVVFYGTGIALYLKSPKLKPAGTTFTGIGLVLAPLVGLAAYNFIYNGQSVRAVWFVTSMVVLGLYLVSVKLVRQTYIAYLMAFVSLSLFESSVNLFNVPLYYLAWGMAIIALLFMLVGRRRGEWEDLNQSFEICANVFLPVSLLLSYVMAQNNGYSQFGITLVLGSLFYVTASSIAKRQDERNAFFGISLALLPVGLVLALQPSLPNTTITYFIVGLGAAYALISEYTAHIWPDIRTQLLAVSGGIIALLATGLVAGSKLNLVVVISLAVVINAFGLIRRRQSANLFLGVIGGMALPYFVFNNLYHISALWLILAYLVMSLGMVALRMALKTWELQAQQVAMCGYIVGFGLALAWATSYSAGALAIVAFIIAIISYWLSYVETEPNVVVVAAILAYVSATAFVYSLKLNNQDLYVYEFLVTGFALYGVGLLQNNLRGRLLRYTGIVGPYLGVAAQGSLDLVHSVPILSLFGGGALTMSEAISEKSIVGQEVAAGVLVAAFEWLLGFAGIRTLQVFTHVWAAYFAILAYRHRNEPRPDNKDLLTVVALAVLTVPLTFESLAPGGQLYGLLLTMESIGIILAGMALRYKLVLYWGIVTLVGEVLYQLKDVILGLPKYFISAGLGLALLGAAIYFLSRRHDG